VFSDCKCGTDTTLDVSVLKLTTADCIIHAKMPNLHLEHILCESIDS